MERKRTVYLSVACYFVDLFEVPVQAGVVVIVPQPAFVSLIPWERPEHLSAPGELIECELPDKQKVVFEHYTHIIYRALCGTCLYILLEQRHPVNSVVFFVRCYALEIFDCALIALTIHKCRNGFQAAGIFAHLEI